MSTIRYGAAYSQYVCRSLISERQKEFQLISPLTGEPVGDSPVSLTIVQAPSNNIVDVLVVEFDPSSSSYRYELNTSDLAGGAYDLYLGLSETGQSHMMQIHVLADSE